MSDSTKRMFTLEGTHLLASGLHAQLIARRRPTFEHDLKNVLHGLMSGTELLSKAMATSSPRITPSECLKLLQKQLERTQGTLQRMLDEVAPSFDEATQVRISELVQECLHDLRHDLQRFQLDSELDESLQAHVHRPLLKDALLYVLMSIMDSLRPGATLSVSTRSADDHASIELRYALVDPSWLEQQLSSVREILSIDNGTLTIDTASASPRVIMSVPRVTNVAANTSGRLLIIDANRDAADSLAMLAQLEGFDASSTYDLDSALRLVAGQSPSAILVDADGSVDCVALVAQVRTLERPPRILAMSHSDRACNIEVDAQLRKPLDPQELRRLLS